MTASLAIARGIAMLLLVIACGFGARRAGVLSRDATASLGRLVAGVTFPALCVRGLAGMDGAELARSWNVPLLGLCALALSTAVGLALARVLRPPPASRPTFVFCVAVGNWIFLPLPLAAALHGKTGTATVLLHNAGAQAFLWTAGLALLRGRFDRQGLRELSRNPGLWATAAGVALAFTKSQALVSAAAASVPALVIADALALVGDLTVPLATLAIGAQLADPGARRSDARAFAGVLAGRMLVAPLVTIAAVHLAARPLGLSRAAESVEHLIAAMPVSLTAGALVQTAGGDAALAARSIAWSTVASVATVPAIHALARIINESPV